MPRPHSKLDALDEKQRGELVSRLHSKQGGLCYICRRGIDLKLDAVDVDHIVPISEPFRGLDDEQNWGVVHRSENESKSNRWLQLMRYIYNYRQLRDDYVKQKGDFTVGDALGKLVPQRRDVIASMDSDTISISYLGSEGVSVKETHELLSDNGIKSFVAMVPFDLIYHDKNVNPRSIAHLEPMIEEFYNRRPQLQPSLAHLEVLPGGTPSKVLLFDGQHKAAAQLFNNRQKLLTRVFVNVEPTLLKNTNFRAHTILAQIHFPDIVEDKVGHDLFEEAFQAYLSKNPGTGSESIFLSSLEEASDYREHLRRYIKYECLFSEGQQHKILNYVETIWARSKRFPLVYDSLVKSFFRFFLYLYPAQEQLNESQAYRIRERENLSRMMTIFVEEILDKRFEIGTSIFKIEQKLEHDPDSVSNNHLAAYRICRAAPMIVWTEQLKKAVVLLLKSHPGYSKDSWADERPLWIDIPEEQWNRVRKMFRVIRDHNVWIEKTNKQAIGEIASTKQKDWKEILLDGRLPGRNEKLFSPLTYNKIHELAIG